MGLEFCSTCGKYVSADESTIRLSKHNNEAEVVCNECLANEQTLSKRADDMSRAKLVSSEIIAHRACKSFR